MIGDRGVYRVASSVKDSWKVSLVCLAYILAVNPDSSSSLHLDSPASRRLDSSAQTLTLEIIDALPEIHEYLDLRGTSRTIREIYDLVSLAVLRRLLLKSMLRVRSRRRGETAFFEWMCRLSQRLCAAGFMPGKYTQQAFCAVLGREIDQALFLMHTWWLWGIYSSWL